MERTCDVRVLGGGPAGASVARLLALRGFSVELRTQAPPARHSLAETLPPSVRNVFHLLGIQSQIDAAGFYRTTGNTSWWGSPRKRAESYPAGSGHQPGHQVLRANFDALLLGLAREAGVRPANEAEAKFTLDCTGRSGALAKRFRVPQPGFRTFALCGIWRGALRGVDPTHTLVEAYPDGWVWSIPLAPDLRYVTVMTERGRVYLDELAKTRVISRLLAKCEQQGKSFGCDASLYSARRFAGDDFLLVGDAGSFVDPISSFGVKKALTSAWVAAATVTTCLRHPEKSAMALGYFDARERQTYADHLRQASTHYAQGAARFGTPFWTTRAAAALPPAALPPATGPSAAAMRAALAHLRATPELHLKLGPSVTFADTAALAGEEIALRRTLIAPGLSPGVEHFHIEHFHGVDLASLVEIAEDHRQVHKLFADYNRRQLAQNARAAPVDLAAFLTALAFLIASQILELRTRAIFTVDHVDAL